MRLWTRFGSRKNTAKLRLQPLEDRSLLSFGIKPTFDTSITDNANSAILQSDINSAIAIYQSLFTDKVTLSILFRYATTAPNGTALGPNLLSQSNYTIFSEPYATYIHSLSHDSAKSPNDTLALAHLPAASAFPNDPLRITVSSANGRALGLGTPGLMNSSGGVGGGGTFDGIVTLNSAQNFSLTRPVGDVGKYDIMQSIEHEIDEVMGFGSILPGTTDFTDNAAVRPQDLFRYSAPGAISLSSSGTVSSYLSIDGGNSNLVPFNQNAGGDFGDWGAGGTPLVQLAFSSPNTQSDVTATSPEGIGLDVIGYDLHQPRQSAVQLGIDRIGPDFIGGRESIGWLQALRPISNANSIAPAKELPTARSSNLPIVDLAAVDLTPIFVRSKPLDAGNVSGSGRSPANFAGLLSDENAIDLNFGQ